MSNIRRRAFELLALAQLACLEDVEAPLRRPALLQRGDHEDRFDLLDMVFLCGNKKPAGWRVCKNIK